MISRTEEMLLLAVCRLQADAFGLNIRKEMQAVTGKRYSVGGIYTPLDRLVNKGLLKTEDGLPTEARMGRPRRLYRISSAGLEALREAREQHEAMWEGLPKLVLDKLRFT